MKINVLFMDDDSLFLSRLMRLVQNKLSNHHIEMNSDSITNNFFNWHFSKTYDVTFLDIDLNSETNGIEIAKSLKQKGIAQYIIFVSNKQHLVFQSLSVQPFYFIRKNHLEEEADIALKLLLDHLDHDRKITMQIMGRTLVFKVSDLYYFEVLNHNIILHFKDKDCIVSSSMTKMLEKLNSKKIIQIHRSYAVNASHILDIYTGEVVLSNHKCIPIGRKYRKDFLVKYREVI